MSVPPGSARISSPVCAVLRPEHEAELAAFFERLRAGGAERFFHPHPLTAAEARQRVLYTGRDFYCVLVAEKTVIGYGMLRGWDEGYAIPSLGVAVDPAWQGRGHARRLMAFLQAMAQQRGCRRIRLKTDAENIKALNLYQSLGYKFEPQADGELLGFLELPPATRAKEDSAR
jgi:ribosomal protein S18 acetylase RimI-like enzyme